MRRRLLLFIFLFPLSAYCQDKWTSITYNGVSIEIPDDWGSLNTVNQYEGNIFKEYQITCWDKSDTNSVTAIYWLDVEIELDYFIKTMMTSLQSRLPLLRLLDFEEIANTYYPEIGVNAKKCHFSKYSAGGNIEGDYIAFNKNGASYLVLICGPASFYRSNDARHIVSSVKPNFIPPPEQIKNENIVTESEHDYVRYVFREFSLFIPITMELRNENSHLSLIRKIFIDKDEYIKKFDLIDDNFIFQPVGLNDALGATDRQKQVINSYARILISHQKGNVGDFFGYEDLSDLQEVSVDLNNLYRDNLITQFEQAKAMGIEASLVKVDNIKIAKNPSNFVYIEQQYIRTGLDGDIQVIDYYIHNNHEMVKLTLSYRISQNRLWESDFNNIIDSFNFSNN